MASVSDRLLEIIRNKEMEIIETKRKHPLEEILERIRSEKVKDPSPLYEALSSSQENERPKIIAEIKRASPSKGMLREGVDVSFWAGCYEKGGASAVSVLTEKRFFLGSVEDLSKVKETVRIPVLRKDFIIDIYQVYESALVGADGILLIARILSLGQLCEFMDIAHSLGMDALVEVHDEEDLEKALKARSRIIGINNRDLKTFSVSLDKTLSLAPRLDLSRCVGVCESGIHSYEDIKVIQKVGINCFLVGESIMRSWDPVRKIKILRGET